MSVFKSVLILLTLICFHQSVSADQDTPKQVIHVSAIDWCPQICPQTLGKPGYMVEMAYDVFKHSDFDLEFEYVPWSRAIYRVKVGETDALLSPSKDEAPELRYHSEPLSYQTHCFWTLRNSDWHFDGVESLARQPFVIYRDHSYASFLASGAVPITSDHYFELIYDERYIPRAIQLLEAKRANAFIFTANSVIFYQKQHDVPSLVIGECIKRDELWFALSPQPSDKIDGIQAHLDDYLAQYKKTERYRVLLEKYDIVLPALYNETTAPAFTQQ